MAASSSETTPLLADTAPAVEREAPVGTEPRTPNAEGPLPASAYFPRTRRHLTIFILVASLITIILAIVSMYLLLDFGFSTSMGWLLLDYAQALLFLVCFLSL